MASKRPGVRGPQGPGNQGPGKQGPGNQGPGKQGSGKQPAASGGSPASLSAFQRRSLPAITFLVTLPRWIVVVLLGSLLVLGIVLSGPLAWLGAIILALIGLFILWLTLLSWPAVSSTGRALRCFVVLAFFIGAVYKAIGKL